MYKLLDEIVPDEGCNSSAYQNHKRNYKWPYEPASQKCDLLANRRNLRRFLYFFLANFFRGWSGTAIEQWNFCILRQVFDGFWSGDS